MAEDKEQLVRLSKKEIDMSETYLIRYAVFQKRTAVAAVLDFADKEWESVKRLREANGVDRNQVIMASDTDDVMGELGTGNETTGGT